MGRHKRDACDFYGNAVCSLQPAAQGQRSLQMMSMPHFLLGFLSCQAAAVVPAKVMMDKWISKE